jgi:hypothetical protein
MMSPIPNSLFAGAYNGSFFPHGAVTFSSRAAAVNVRIEICITGRIDPIKVITGRLDGDLILAAGILDTLPLEGETLTFQNIDGDVVTNITLEGVVEDC